MYHFKKEQIHISPLVPKSTMSSLTSERTGIFVFMFAYGIYKQVDNIDQLEDISFFKTEIVFATVFLFFIIFRFFYMTKTQKTSLPVDTPKFQTLAAKIVHFSMYISLAGIAGSGLMIGYLFSSG